MINYSIIIPHRNSLDKLIRSVNSIPKRNDIQVIIVDNSTEKIDLNIVKDKFLENLQILKSDVMKGAGHARNIGLDQSIGKWILFLDADDYFVKNAFTSFDKYLNSNFDLVYFKSTSSFEGSEERISDRHISYSNLIDDYITKKNNSSDHLRLKYAPPWGKLIKLDLIRSNEIYFDEVCASNDIMFSVKVGYKALNVEASNSVVYHIKDSENSLTKTNTLLNSRSRFKVGVNYYKFLKKIKKHKQLPHLTPQVILSLRFGFSEFFWYLKYSYKNKINLFLKFKSWPKMLVKYFCKK